MFHLIGILPVSHHADDALHPPESQRDAAGLLIRWSSSGTHAEVSLHRAGEPVPPQAHLLRPGADYYGVPYELWAEWVDRTADVLHLQSAAEQARAPRPTLPVAARLADDGWQAEPAIALLRPADAEYGFTTGSRLVPCSRRQLIAQCVDVPETPRVWTPEAPDLVRPETVPFLVDALRAHRRQEAERSVLTAGLVLLASLWLTVGTGFRPGWIMLTALAAAWISATLLEYRQARATGPDAFSAAREEFRHEVWVGSRRAVYTEWILGMLAVVFLAQSFGMTAAVDAAGLVKPAVREGEPWRLLTGPLLHGGVLHLGLNGLALWSLGPLVEAHSRRAFLPLLFLVSALCGSLLSLYLLPGSTSVGASGGLLGLAGYLLLLGFRRRHALPAGFVRRVGIGVLATAVFGLVGYQWVDNATHLGGLLGGMLLAAASGGPGAGEASLHGGAASRAGELAFGILLVSSLACLTAVYLGLREAALLPW